MPMMTRTGLNYLARALGEARTDWDMQTILGALHRIDRTRGNTTPFVTIMVACALAADDVTLDPPAMADDGPHWRHAQDMLLMDLDTGRRWANRHSRLVLQDAQDARHTAADPLTAAGYAKAAREALAARQATPTAS